jgi:predicted Zn-dependent peptidase
LILIEAFDLTLFNPNYQAMRNYTATYKDSLDNIIQKITFESKNLKEARKQAQQYKSMHLRIKKTGRIRTLVEISEEDQRELVFKRLQKLLKENEKLQRDYEKYKDTFSNETKEELKDFFE